MGLTTPKERLKASFFLQGLPKPVDIVCGQEHKIRSPNIVGLNGIWLEAEFICALADDGVHARCNQFVLARKGGVFMAIGPSFHSYIIDKGITMLGRAVWAHFNHPQLGKIGGVIVYAPNNHKQREALWNELSLIMLDKCKPWVIVGDYNMIDAQGDRKGGSGKILKGVERRAWNHFKRRFNLVDSHVLKLDYLKYSWDSKHIHRHNPWVQNCQNIGKRVLKRIDCIYSSQCRLSNSCSISSSILPKYCFSNHAPMLARISTSGPKIRLTMYRINTKHVQEVELLDKLRNLLETLQRDMIMEGRPSTDLLLKVYILARKSHKPMAKLRRKKGGNMRNSSTKKWSKLNSCWREIHSPRLARPR